MQIDLMYFFGGFVRKTLNLLSGSKNRLVWFKIPMQMYEWPTVEITQLF